MQIKNGTDNDHVYSDSYASTGEKHWKVCTLCGITALEGGHTYDTDNQCTVCGRESGKRIYWDETELTFEINEHTNYGQTDNYFVKI